MKKIAYFPIEEVARDTGIGKDTLRVWERRYGFPNPQRSKQGERGYTTEQVVRLHKIRCLLDQGFRPGKVVALADEQLQALSHRTNENGDQSSYLLHYVYSDDPDLLHQELTANLEQLDLESFVIEIVAPLTKAIGDAWAFGDLPIYAEHQATQVIQRTLIKAISEIAFIGNPKRAILTTIAGERHQLGLLMAEAILASRGIKTINLGTETPLTEIPQAAHHYSADIVAISFSQIQSRTVVVESLQALCSQLPLSIQVLTGGQSIRHYKRLPGRVQVHDLRSLVDWCKQFSRNTTPIVEKDNNADVTKPEF